jgi:ABC-2 type transport system ATP-binding protein
MASGGTTVFVSTHYMEEDEYCHKLALMNRGRLIALDTPKALRQRVVEPILRVDTDHAARSVEALTGVAGIVDAAMFGRALHVTVEDERAGPAAVRAALASAGRTLHSIEPIEPSLEDVFVALVRAEGGAVVG